MSEITQLKWNGEFGEKCNLPIDCIHCNIMDCVGRKNEKEGPITSCQKGYCDTCKHRQIREDCLRKGLDGEKWGVPCRDCDIHVNYLWEPSTNVIKPAKEA